MYECMQAEARVLILGRTSWHYDVGRRATAARQSQSRAAPAAASPPSAAPSPPPAATERGSAGAEALAERRAAPRTPRCGPSDERSVRRRRAASPAVSRESGATTCAQPPPRQRRAAATSANCHWRFTINNEGVHRGCGAYQNPRVWDFAQSLDSEKLADPCGERCGRRRLAPT